MYYNPFKVCFVYVCANAGQAEINILVVLLHL